MDNITFIITSLTSHHHPLRWSHGSGGFVLLMRSPYNHVISIFILFCFQVISSCLLSLSKEIKCCCVGYIGAPPEVCYGEMLHHISSPLAQGI